MAPYDIPSGLNYALVIEHAILHAGRFVLMLSPSAAQSVWVGKELKRAIARFQLEAPEKICVAWLDRPFQLVGTPMALPLEDIQTVIQIRNNPDNYLLLRVQLLLSALAQNDHQQSWRGWKNFRYSPKKTGRNANLERVYTQTIAECALFDTHTGKVG